MTVLLHAVVWHTRLALWGEMTGGALTASPLPATEKPSAMHPDAVDLPSVRDILGTLGLRREPIQFLPKDFATLWLPTLNDQPMRSDALPSESDLPITLCPWTVPVLILDGPIMIQFLEGCRQQINGDNGTALSLDLKYWVLVSTQAQSLVFQQQFIPGLRVLVDGAYEACWQPHLAPAVQASLEVLAASMPGVARAWGADSDHAPAHDPMSVLYAVLTTLVDTLVRQLAAPTRRRFMARSAWGYGNAAQTPSLPERWKLALHPDESPFVHAASAHMEPFLQKIQYWHAQVQERPTSRFRLCFQLEDVIEPSDEGDVVHWVLRVSLQSLADPSLLLPLADVWHTARLAIGDLKGVTHADVLSMVGSTIAVLPPLARSLSSTQPGVIDLTTDEAYTFLTEAVQTLQQAGHLVQLPSWWHANASPRRVQAQAQIRGPSRTPGKLGMEALLNFSWALALGDDPITRAELEELAQHKEPLVRFRGQWLQVDQDAIAMALDHLRQRTATTIPVREALALALAPSQDEATQIDPDAWLADLLHRLRSKATYAAIPTPRDLRVTLRPYQARAFAWLHFLTQFGFGACLADQMGLGKTLSTLALIGKHWEEQGAQPTLVVAPVSVIDHWRQEAMRSLPQLPVVIYHGARRQETHEQLMQAGLVVTSYGILQRDRETLRSIQWRAIIADEAQVIKNATTRQAQAMRQLTAAYRIALTGTPVENRVEDLWSLFDFLNPGYLGTHAAFTRSFSTPIAHQQDGQATATLRQLVNPFLLRRLKSDPEVAPDLPAKIEQTSHCVLTREQASLYAAAVSTLARDLAHTTGMQRRGLILRSLTHLKQICDAPSLFLKDGSALAGRSGKLARLEDLLEEMLANGECGLIFTQFAELGHQLQQHLAERFGQPVFYLDGQTPKAERDRLIAAFQRGEAPIFVLSLKAGGAGITLTAATVVVHFDRWWNPAVEDQASDRAHRLGQHHTVTVQRLVCQGTIEERIDALQAGKRTLADGLIIVGEEQLTELDTETLLDLVRLQAEEMPL